MTFLNLILEEVFVKKRCQPQDDKSAYIVLCFGIATLNTRKDLSIERYSQNIRQKRFLLVSLQIRKTLQVNKILWRIKDVQKALSSNILLSRTFYTSCISLARTEYVVIMW